MSDFVEDGYPTEEAITCIEVWPAYDFEGLIEFVRSIWHWPERATFEGGKAEFITGGWKGNEEIIAALKSNDVWWMMFWEQSTRGGYHVFSRLTNFEKHKRELEAKPEYQAAVGKAVRREAVRVRWERRNRWTLRRRGF